MEFVKVKLAGVSPLIVQADTLANPLREETKALKAITGKRKKTEDDLLAIFRIEWDAGLYYSPEIGPYMPGLNLDRAIVQGARLSKRGKDVERAVMTRDQMIPLLYDGPRNPDKMYVSGKFTDVRSVVIGGRRTMRCRPIFPEWGMETTIDYDESVIDHGDLLAFLKSAGQYVSIGTFRPRYGRFEVKEL